MSDEKDNADKSNNQKSSEKTPGSQVVRTYKTASGSVYKEFSDGNFLRKDKNIGEAFYVSPGLVGDLAKARGQTSCFNSEGEKERVIKRANELNYTSPDGHLLFFDKENPLKYFCSKGVVSINPPFKKLEDSLDSGESSGSFNDYHISDKDVEQADGDFGVKKAPYEKPVEKKQTQPTESTEEYLKRIEQFKKQQKKKEGLFSFISRKKKKK